MSVAVVTIVRGRHDHLGRQLTGLASGVRTPDRQIIVAMDDPAVHSLTAEVRWPCEVLDVAVAPGAGLPLAQARNAGARAALDAGASALIFLDVDCIPGPELVQRYADLAADPHYRSALLCGSVSYLPPPGPAGYPADRLDELARPHPARPAPPRDVVLVARDRRLFWSLSFALSAPAWTRIGGFCPTYVGYGGEDTDYSEAAHSAGVSMYWVGGAPAFHQHHPSSSPPTQHLESIIRNAAIFHARWGWWPMQGWLEEFARRGLAHFDAQQGWTVAQLNHQPVGKAGSITR